MTSWPENPSTEIRILVSSPSPTPSESMSELPLNPVPVLSTMAECCSPGATDKTSTSVLLLHRRVHQTNQIQCFGPVVLQDIQRCLKGTTQCHSEPHSRRPVKRDLEPLVLCFLLVDDTPGCAQMAERLGTKTRHSPSSLAGLKPLDHIFQIALLDMCRNILCMLEKRSPLATRSFRLCRLAAAAFPTSLSFVAVQRLFCSQGTLKKLRAQHLHPSSAENGAACRGERPKQHQLQPSSQHIITCTRRR